MRADGAAGGNAEAKKTDRRPLYGNLSALPLEFQKPAEDVISSNWLVSLLLPRGVDRDQIIEEMRKDGVDTRPVFHCSHHLPMYASAAPRIAATSG